MQINRSKLVHQRVGDIQQMPVHKRSKRNSLVFIRIMSYSIVIGRKLTENSSRIGSVCFVECSDTQISVTTTFSGAICKIHGTELTINHGRKTRADQGWRNGNRLFTIILERFLTEQGNHFISNFGILNRMDCLCPAIHNVISLVFSSRVDGSRRKRTILESHPVVVLELSDDFHVYSIFAFNQISTQFVRNLIHSELESRRNTNAIVYASFNIP